MNPAGVVLVVAGVWALTQLLKGDALGRLGLLGSAPTSRDTSSSSSASSSTAGAVASMVAGGSALQQSVVRAALALQGVPYVALSDPPRSFNCSTFTSYVYKQATGLDLPPLTWTQVGMGQSVPIGPEFAQPGDLIFSADNEGRAFGHVGIVVDAHTKIHAPHTGDVVRLAPIDWGSVQAVRRYIA